MFTHTWKQDAVVISQDGCMRAASQACTYDLNKPACQGQSPGRAERGNPSTPLAALVVLADGTPHSETKNIF